MLVEILLENINCVNPLAVEYVEPDYGVNNSPHAEYHDKRHQGGIAVKEAPGEDIASKENCFHNHKYVHALGEEIVLILKVLKNLIGFVSGYFQVRIHDFPHTQVIVQVYLNLFMPLEFRCPGFSMRKVLSIMN